MTKTISKCYINWFWQSNDYSTWTFVYTDKYYLIQKGLNELTAKLSCIDDNNNDDAAKVTKWYSVNVIGVSSYGN